MQYAIAALAGFSAVAYARPQGVTAQLSPPGTPICSPNYSGGFQISVVNATTSAAKIRRAVNPNDLPGNALILTLQGGVLKDQSGRTGYIAANRQFQFDSPPQTGAIWTSGFSVCPNNTLGLTSTLFYQCYSGGFYNLYDRPAESNCSGIYFETLASSPNGQLEPIPVSTSVGPVTVSAASQIPDGQPQGPTQASIAPVTQITDGQPQGPTAPVVTQITDGQVQAPTAPVVTQITDGQVQAPTAPVVSQITDGQVQAPTGPVVSQITDGQVQAPTAPVVSQITDGQVQAPTAPVVSQITDGQVQAPTAPVVTQITDGQVQAPTGPVVSQITDGQIQAPPNSTVPPPFTGGAVTVTGGNYMAAAVGAIFLGAILL